MIFGTFFIPHCDLLIAYGEWDVVMPFRRWARWQLLSRIRIAGYHSTGAGDVLFKIYYITARSFWIAKALQSIWLLPAAHHIYKCSLLWTPQTCTYLPIINKMCYTWQYFCWVCRNALALVYGDCPTPRTCGNRRTDVPFGQGGRVFYEQPLEYGMRCATCSPRTAQEHTESEDIATIPNHQLDGPYVALYLGISDLINISTTGDLESNVAEDSQAQIQPELACIILCRNDFQTFSNLSFSKSLLIDIWHITSVLVFNSTYNMSRVNMRTCVVPLLHKPSQITEH